MRASTYIRSHARGHMVCIHSVLDASHLKSPMYTSEFLVLVVENQTLPATPPFTAALSGDGLTGTSWPELMTETDVALKLA